jgi:cytidylate kinase
LQWEVDPADDERRTWLLERAYIDVDEYGGVLLEGKDISDQIGTPEVAQMASKISIYPNVRERMVALQKEIAKDGGYVIDGRDIGTIVFPDAEVKMYLVATPQVRAIRRHKDILKGDHSTKISDIVSEIEQRDRRDTERTVSPLRKADDAVELDTSNMTFEAQVDYIVDLAKERIETEKAYEG